MNMKRIFTIKPSVIIFLVVSTILLLIYSLGFDHPIFFIQYFSYLYSTFSLVVVLCNMRRFYHFLKEKIIKSNVFQKLKKNLYQYPVIQRYFEEVRFRTFVNLCCSTFINFTFLFIKLANGVVNRSIWFVSLSIYYLLLTSIKVFLLHNIRKFQKDREFQIYRRVGYFIMLLNILLLFMIVQMVRSNVAIVSDGYMIYLTALYSFYLIISAIINVFRYKKYHSPILSSVKIINLLTASVSILMLQTTMIATFSVNDMEFMRMMNLITGSIISVITLGISTYMILHVEEKKK